MNAVNEAVLEMHFHKAIVDALESVYGARFLRLLKPSTVREAWVGFDQGWVRADLSNDELMGALRKTIGSQGSTVNRFYLGYFLQFKVVEAVARRSPACPAHYATPYLRARLSLKPNKTTQLSQHETLLRLSSVKGAAEVSYVCPMLLSVDDVYEEADTDLLRFVAVKSAPSGWATNQSHYITFQDENDQNPQWCSEPSDATCRSFRDWVSGDGAPQQLDNKGVRGLLKSVDKALTLRSTKRAQTGMSPLPLPQALSLVEFESLGARDASAPSVSP